MLKKILLGVLILIVLVLAAAFILPIVYKDKIKAAIDKEIANSVNANVYFNANDFSVSLFRHFPNATASLKNFGITGNDDFEGDSLVSISSFEVTVNIWDLIGGNINVKNIDLVNPRIQAIILKDGKANWNIMKPDTTKKTNPSQKPSTLSIKIDHWSIENGYIVYDDRSSNMYMKLTGVNHNGNGDFSKNIFDMVSTTNAESLSFKYGGVEYISDKKLFADMTLGMDLNNSKYTFKQNTFRLNDFSMGFDGSIAMPDTNIDFDITYKVKETSFKNLLSLMPGAYTKDFKDLKADGDIKFDGYAKGRYNKVSIPGFGVNLLVNNASFQYAGLPVPVKNINVDMKVDDKDGILNNIIVDIKKFHLDMGNNPVDGKVWLQGLTKYNIDANIMAKVNLAEISKIYPIKGIIMSGLYGLNLKAKGIYNKATDQIPAIDAKMSLVNGYVKSKDFPAPLEQMNLLAEVVNSSGKIPDTKIHVSEFKMLLEGEPFEATAYLENLNDYTYDVHVKGALDFTKITKIYPLKGMTLTGRAKANITTKGKMSDVTAKRYDKLPTSGTASLSNFTFKSESVPQGVKITNAIMEFSPKAINLSSFEGFLGKSDVSLKGTISNYIGYVIGKEIIEGKLAFKSNKFDVNEWMSKGTTHDTTKSAPLKVIEIPKNIDFTLASSIGEVLYTNMNMKNMIGTIYVKNGIVTLEKLGFNMLGGNFIANGNYNTQDIKDPKFAFDLNIDNLGISDAFKTFNTVKALMPFAQSMDGKFSTKFNLVGNLMNNMMPKMNSLTGGGLIKLFNAVLTNAPAMNALSSFTKLGDIKQSKLSNLILTADVKDGWVEFQPFDLDLNGYKVNVTKARNNVDGNLDGVLKIDLPGGQIGNLANNAIAQITGKSIGADQTIKLDLGVTGTYNKPQIKLLGTSTGTAAKDAITSKLNDEKDKLKKQAEDKMNAELDKAKTQVDKIKAEQEAKIKAEQDKLTLEADKKKKEIEDQVKAGQDKINADLQKRQDEIKKNIENEKKKALNNLFNKP